jgi:hypothetical protein
MAGTGALREAGVGQLLDRVAVDLFVTDSLYSVRVEASASAPSGRG